MPTAVLRRYTPPTCTLEVTASSSALSRWTNRTVLKNLQFQLSFDDPKLMPDQQVMVSGDQNQLEALHQMVTDYVQQLLGQAPAAVNWEPSLCLDQRDPPSAQRPNQQPDSLPEPAIPSRESDSPQALALQPEGLLSHELSLGSLANSESGETVRLSTLQLFDLANALEDYHAESLSLPVAEPPAWMSKLPRNWSSAAAAVLALVATGAMTKFVLDISRPAGVQTASAPSERQVNAELNRELFPKLSPPSVSPSVTIQPLPPPPPTGANRDALGLPPIGVTETPPRPAVAPAPGAVPGQAVGQAAGQAVGPSQVTILPNSGGGALPSTSTIAAAPPRLAPNADSLAADSTASSSVSESGLAAPQAASRAAGVAPPATNTTAFDTIPQVAEVRTYFQQRWQPPSGLNQTLEYRLLLNADGSLQRIVPLGQFSENYLDRTNMPLMGEPFVSATSNGKTPQIRLVLKPDGKVQSFLEYAN